MLRNRSKNTLKIFKNSDFPMTTIWGVSLKRKILDRKRIPDFPGFRSIRFQKKVRAFRVQSIWSPPKWAKWRPAADTSLYRDPYYNGIWEIQCTFWRFFESVGSHKRSQTLPVITSDNKYICNIKIKIKIFSTWFSSDFELDLHPKKWRFCSKYPLSCQCVEECMLLLQKPSLSRV